MEANFEHIKDVKPGDIIVLCLKNWTADGLRTILDVFNQWLKRKGFRERDVELLVLNDCESIEVADGERMKAAGWIRAQQYEQIRLDNIRLESFNNELCDQVAKLRGERAKWIKK